MPDSPERRAKPRILLGAEFTARFLVKGHEFRNVRLTNLSPDGCFAMVHGGEAGLFTQGSVLEAFTFEHPDLPGTPLTGRVTYALRTQGPNRPMEFLGLGIHFALVPPAAAEALRRYVMQHQPF